MNLATIIALLAIGGFIVFVIAVNVFRSSLADLAIDFVQKAYNAGDTVDVTFKIDAHKDLVWSNVTLSLRCLDLSERDPVVPYFEIYRDETELASTGELSGKSSRSFTARFVVPDQIDANALKIDAPESVEKVLEPVMDIAMRRRAMDIRWEIEAIIETDNHELKQTEKISIGVMP